LDLRLDLVLNDGHCWMNRRLIPLGLVVLLVAATGGSAVVGTLAVRSTPSSGSHRLTYVVPPETYVPPPETIATTVYVGKFHDSAVKLRVTTVNKSGSWVIRASLGTKQYNDYQLAPLPPPHVPQRSFVFPLVFVLLPDRALPGVVIQTEGYANTESLSFFDLNGSHIALISATSGDPELQGGFIEGGSVTHGYGLQCSWQGGFSVLATSWAATFNGQSMNSTVLISRTLFKLGQDDQFVAHSLPSITDSYMDADYNSYLECGM
jgi:hypothetical protein